MYDPSIIPPLVRTIYVFLLRARARARRRECPAHQTTSPLFPQYGAEEAEDRNKDDRTSRAIIALTVRRESTLNLFEEVLGMSSTLSPRIVGEYVYVSNELFSVWRGCR